MNTPLPLLAVQNVAFSVAGRARLQPVSFELHPGDALLVTGSSGSGKSTLLKIIASLVNPSAGQVLFQNRDITTLKPETYRQQVSYCFQTPQLFGQTVYDNLALPWQIRRLQPERDKLVAALESVNLAADRLNTPIEQLSGGEKQRVGLLRNVQFVPAVLLLDEVTSALDAENRHTVLNMINRLSVEKNVAVVRISHDMSDIQHAKRVLRLNTVHQEDTRESA